MAVVAMVNMKVKKIFAWSDCNEYSLEWSLGYVVMHLRFEISKMAIIETMKVYLFWSDYNQTLQDWSGICSCAKSVYWIMNFKTLNIKWAMDSH